MVAVDSSVWIEALRRQGDLKVKLGLEGLLEHYQAQLLAPVRLEVLGGAREEERWRLSTHFACLPFRRVTDDDWERAVALAWRLRDQGISVPWRDALIAALALHDRVRLYTLDAHFTRIAEVTGLRLYQPGHAGLFAPE